MCARRRKQPEQTLFAFAEERETRRKGVDELFDAVEGYGRGARFLQLLGQIARFRSYGPYNALLAAIQRPRARCILPPAKWRKYNREPRREAVPIVLLRPFSPVTCVFDVADTRVIRGREDRFPAELAREEAYEPPASVPDAVVRRLVDRLPWWGILHEVVPTGPSASGDLHLADAAVPEMQVRVKGDDCRPWRPAYVLATRMDVSSTDLFAALVHELARLFCHHLHCGFEKGWEGGRELSAQGEAFEADVVTWLVSRRLDVASPAYRAVADYLDANGKIPAISMDAVLEAVAEVETMLGADSTVRNGYLYRLSPSFARETSN